MGPIHRARARLYDLVIVSMTAGWYLPVLQRLRPGSHLLDVGIGTGGALLVHAERLLAGDLKVTGIDIDAAYVEQCRRAVAAASLSDRVHVEVESVYDHQGGPYDAVYFSGSFMLLPDPSEALRRVANLLAPAGAVYFTQTFEHRRSRTLEVAKPLLRWVTTIDFGRVTYEEDFKAALAAAEMRIAELQNLHVGKRRSSVLVVAYPEAAAMTSHSMRSGS
jgi:cyclopropane fatty-acyl-phospholipid synthase-like methyltransferase